MLSISKKIFHHCNSCMVIVVKCSFPWHYFALGSAAQGDWQYSKGIKERRRCRCTNEWMVFGLQYLCLLCRTKQKPKHHTYKVVQQEHLCWGAELAWLIPLVPGARKFQYSLSNLTASICIYQIIFPNFTGMFI